MNLEKWDVGDCQRMSDPVNWSFVKKYGVDGVGQAYLKHIFIMSEMSESFFLKYIKRK